MIIKFFFIEVVVFLISLFISNITLKLFQKTLSKAHYEFTTKFRYALSCLIMLIVGITVGKIIIGNII